ncbi:TPA: hypothetical protein N0F65_009790, partial [Lagenidium giganteum]
FFEESNVVVSRELETVKATCLARLARIATHSDAAMLSSISLPNVQNDWQDLVASEFYKGLMTVENDGIKFAGECYFAASKLRPQSAAAWRQFSDWCYERSKEGLEGIVALGGYIQLSSDEENDLAALLANANVAESDRAELEHAFCLCVENGSVLIRRRKAFEQLCSQRISESDSFACVERLLELYDQVHTRVFRFHRLAALGYGSFLKVAHTAATTQQGQSDNVTVCLRLLRLITKFGAEKALADVFSSQIETTPVAPWCQIVPQLLSRVEHPIPAISLLVTRMLKRISAYAPHLVVYPAVVDSMSKISKAGLNRKSALDDVLAKLKHASPGLVHGIGLFVSELRRISVLWDESWINTLTKISTDVARRSSTLEKESARVEKNATLSVDEKRELATRKLVAIMKPVLVSLERLWNETAGASQAQATLTPHERSFLHHYGAMIHDGLSRFRACCGDQVEGPAAHAAWGDAKPTAELLWAPFAEVLKMLMASTARREQLPLLEISPSMASMALSPEINMPGMTTSQALTPSESRLVLIKSAQPVVTVLRTKTKPKRIEFIGSDGRAYRFLLKAREDLRLDERIMQFLKTINMFLRADDAAAVRGLNAQNYSVTPIAEDAGLIQMVPDVVPLFHVYTSWSDQSQLRSPQASPPSSIQQPPPPTAAFYSKLKQYGVADVSPNQRSRWPAPILKQVFHDLVMMMPRNVLQSELMRGSADSNDFWNKQARFSRSLAVMSVLGYLVGLGDRHLDNILLCKKSGEVVHIDYNVCFEKGLKLKVPEIVPFRLTPMLQDALGLTGVEGRFRAAFEHTLRVVRDPDSKEALLTLLEAFIYDPLADWRLDSDQHAFGDLKTRLEVNVNLSLFLSRAEERRQEATDFGVNFAAVTVALSNSIHSTRAELESVLEQCRIIAVSRNQVKSMAAAVDTLEAEVANVRSVWNSAHGELMKEKAQCEELTTKMTAFARECESRHQQIELWRGKAKSCSVISTTSLLENRLKESSLRTLCSEISNSLGLMSRQGKLKEVIDGAASKCVDLDAKLLRHVARLQDFVSSVQPHLTAYAAELQQMDEYVLLEDGVIDDVYQQWSVKCGQLLSTDDGNASEKENHSTPAVATGLSLLHESIQATEFLARWKGSGGAAADDNMLNTLGDKLNARVQDLSDALTSMRLSNAQCQRIMKLAGASWLVSSLEQWTTAVTEPAGASPLLAAMVVNKFMSALKSTLMLLDIISTPKGSIKRLHCKEMLELHHSHSNAPKAECLSEAYARELTAWLNQECKFTFEATETAIEQRWQEFERHEVAQAVPATTGPVERSLEAYTKVRTALRNLADDCTRTCLVHLQREGTKEWSAVWNKANNFHRGRICYIRWLSSSCSQLLDSSALTRKGLLEILSSRVAALSAMLQDQAQLESAVLEVAQQLEYVAAQLSSIPSAQHLHRKVQESYARLVSIFDFGRELADYVQGVSVIETSTRRSAIRMDVEKQIVLEVDKIGDALIHDVQASNSRVADKERHFADRNVVLKGLETQLLELKTQSHALQTQAAAAEQRLFLLADSSKEVVQSMIANVYEHARALLSVLKAFDKLKTPMKERVMAPANQDLVNTDNTRSTSFSFVESERLIKILSRSIRSVKYLDELGRVLEDHESKAAALHEVVGVLTEALLCFVQETRPHLNQYRPTSPNNIGKSPSFLEVAQTSAIGGSIQAGLEPLAKTAKIITAFSKLIEALAMERGGRERDSESRLRALPDGERLDSFIELSEQLLQNCLSLFFEATEMTNRYSLEGEAVVDSEDALEGEAIEDVTDNESSNELTLGLPADSELRLTHAQQKNQHGIQVLQRIDEKLSGLKDSSRDQQPMSIENQASWLIGEATSVDNLCMMYEGWTPWI